MRTLLMCCLMLATAACFAQTGGSPSVVMGQTASGENIITTIIPLKYLDPMVAADLLAALGFPGTVIPVNPPHRPGEAVGAYQGNGNTMSGHQRGRAGTWRSNSRTTPGANSGYDGYQGAGAVNQRYPGYQSPYDHR
ncbi:MAG: hypothetical protein KKI08_10410 [Armatimonadetes bacterium]|nr:hypothetical protein [Armatimonadota bacterium]